MDGTTDRSDVVEEFRQSVDDLAPQHLLALSARPVADEREHLEVARALARQVGVRSRRAAELRALHDDVVRWSGVGGARAGIWAPTSFASDAFLADLRARAMPAVLDAATATVLGDELDPEARATLLRRWRSVFDAE